MTEPTEEKQLYPAQTPAPPAIPPATPETEAELVAEVNALIEATKEDHQHIRKWWRIGQLLAHAIKREWVPKGKMKQWVPAHLNCSYQWANTCLRCFLNRGDWPAAYARYQKQTEWQPKRRSGPEFMIETIRAAKHGFKLPATKKRAAQTHDTWRERFYRLADEHRRWAKQSNRSPRVLIAIEREIAAEESPQDVAPEVSPDVGADDRSSSEVTPETETTAEPITPPVGTSPRMRAARKKEGKTVVIDQEEVKRKVRPKAKRKRTPKVQFETKQADILE